MVITIKQNSTKDTVKKLLAQLFANKQKGVDAHKYCGTVNFKEDALAIQKKMRNEYLCKKSRGI